MRALRSAGLLLPLVAYLPATASAATWYGGDYGGQDVVTADGDVLSGVLVNVGRFVVPAGTTAYVEPAVDLAVSAVGIDIGGTLDAGGAGALGGEGGRGGGTVLGGSAGFGLGAGIGGQPGPCVHGGGGSGAGHGAVGG